MQLTNVEVDVHKQCLPAALVALVIGLAACGSPPVQQQVPAVKIIEPANGSSVALNTEIPVRVEYEGQAVVQVVLLINGQKLGTLPMMPGGTGTSMLWTPMMLGNHVLYLEARDANDTVLARSDIVSVMVESPTPVAVPTDPPTPTLPLDQTVEPAATSVTSVTSPAAVTQTTTPSLAVTAPVAPVATSTPGINVSGDFVNMRSGPGTAYDLVGQLKQGATARVIGKSSDGQWWRINVDDKTAWVSGQYVQANEAANRVTVVEAPALPTSVPATAAAPLPTATALPAVTPAQAVAQVEPPPPTAAPVDDCNPSNPFWAATLNNNPDYAFCTPVPFEFVPNASPDPDEMVIRWQIYGIQSLELRMDPSSDSCGMGTTGFRQQVPFKEDNFRLNRRSFPPGGYKLGLWATLTDGRVQDWGELHFCGK